MTPDEMRADQLRAVGEEMLRGAESQLARLPVLAGQVRAAAIVGKRLPELLAAQVQRRAAAGELGSTLVECVNTALAGGATAEAAAEMAFATVAQMVAEDVGDAIASLGQRWELEAAEVKGGATVLATQGRALLARCSGETPPAAAPMPSPAEGQGEAADADAVPLEAPTH